MAEVLEIINDPETTLGELVIKIEEWRNKFPDAIIEFDIENMAIVMR